MQSAGWTIGENDFFELQAEPSVVRVERGNERLQFEIEVRSNLRSTSAAQVSYRLTDTRGKRVGNDTIEPAQSLAPKGTVSWEVTTAADLPDGAYKYRILAVATDGQYDTLRHLDIAFRVERGRYMFLTMNDWYAIPAANQGFTLEEAE